MGEAGGASFEKTFTAGLLTSREKRRGAVLTRECSKRLYFVCVPWEEKPLRRFLFFCL